MEHDGRRKRSKPKHETSTEVLIYENRGTKDVIFAARLLDKVANWMVLVGPRELLRSCPELTLTIASLERSLFNYIHVLLHHAKGSSGHAKLGLGIGNQTLRNITDALEQELPRMEQDPSIKKKFPRPVGGMCSLLFFLTLTLESTISTIQELAFLKSLTLKEQDFEDPIWEAESQQRMQFSVFLPLETLFGLSLGGATSWLLSRSGKKSIQGNTRSIAVLGCSVGAWIGGVSIFKLFWRNRLKTQARARLMNCNESLSTLLKLMILVMNIVDVEAVRRIASYHTLFLDPSEDDHVSKPTSRTLLELCPLPSITSFWYEDAEISVYLFRRLMDSLYAALGQTGWIWEYATPAIGFPVTMALALFYGLVNPKGASTRACIEMQKPSVKFIRRAWGPVNSDIVVGLSRMIGYFQGLRYQRFVVIDDIPCRVYAQKEPSGPETDVILFIHGGAFIASLHSADIPLITTWAKTGAVIVVPDYSLSPESPYPTPLIEIVNVYIALNNKRIGVESVDGISGVDWLPPVRSILVAGESAGGNLAAALTIRILQIQDQVETSNPHLAKDTIDHAGSRVVIPEGLILIYPALNFSLAPSPSRAVLNFDPVMPLGIMYLVLDAYPGQQNDGKSSHLDSCLSPYHCPDNYLRRFPPTILVAGGFDPLLDDAVDFDTRLRRVGVSSALHMEPSLPHGFIGLIPVSVSARRAIAKTLTFINDIVRDEKILNSNN